MLKQSQEVIAKRQNPRLQDKHRLIQEWMVAGGRTKSPGFDAKYRTGAMDGSPGVLARHEPS